MIAGVDLSSDNAREDGHTGIVISVIPVINSWYSLDYDFQRKRMTEILRVINIFNTPSMHFSIIVSVYGRDIRHE